MYTKIVIVLLGVVGLALTRPGIGSAQTPDGPSDPRTVEAQRSAELSAMMAAGARVFSNNCGRCHNLRASTERTDQQWNVIVAHMRARANLTRSEAEAVRIFLQMTNNDGETPSLPPSTSSVVPVEDTVAVLRQMEERDR